MALSSLAVVPLGPLAASPAFATTAATAASFTYPLQGQAGVDTTRAFTWSTVPDAQGYIFVVGTTVHGTDLVNSGILASTTSSAAVPALPTDRILHATLLTKHNDAWTDFSEVSFTAAAGLSTMTNPLPGQLNVDTTTFTWSTSPASQGTILAVGTTPFGTDLVNSGILPVTQSSFAVPALPGGVLYANLLTKVNGAFTRYQQIAFTAAHGGARFTNPLDGQSVVDPTRAFTWAPVAGGQGYILVVGRTQYGTDVVNSGILPAGQSSFPQPPLPGAIALFATLLTKVNGAWVNFQAIVFTATRGTQWLRATPAKVSPAVYASAMAPSPDGHLVLFGGANPAETWAWGGSFWTQLHPAHQPSARYFPAMVYDSARRQSVLFGGRDLVTDATLADTWIWDGNDWTLANPAVSPPARYIHSMAYDDAEQRVVLYGGAAGSTPLPILADTWEWDGLTWAQRLPATSPGPRYQTVMAYDSLRGRVVLFGGLPNSFGFPLGDTWTWDGRTWTNANPAQSPPPLDGGAMAFDPRLGVSVMFGGEANQSPPFTWLWNGTTWTSPTMSAFPADRKYEAMAYDDTTGDIVMFGGLTPSSGTANDTWRL